jgi:hypothetical protein
MNIFEQATKNALRFDTQKGELNVEDLWNLPLTSSRTSSLNSVAVHYHGKIQKEDAVSFVTPATQNNNDASIKLEILKHIISVKQTENASIRLAADNKAKKTRILQLIAEKQDTNLASKSEEELLALANSLS